MKSLSGRMFHLVQSGGPEVSLEAGTKYRGKGKGPTRGPWAPNPQGWFSAGYGPFRRLYGASREAQRIMSDPSPVARFATMFREDASLSECELWLKELHVKKLENRAQEAAILTQVLQLLDNDFLRNGLRVYGFDSDGLKLRDVKGIILPLADMSEGYRAALALLVDIVKHLVGVYGHEQLIEQQGDRLVIPHRGVVLIDEIDAHLHPEWQRQVGFWLKDHFPNLQFLVTTHSAIICQAADTDMIFHLPPPGSEEEPFQLNSNDYQKIIKSRPDDILLSPAFGLRHTRSPRACKHANNMPASGRSCALVVLLQRSNIRFNC